MAFSLTPSKRPFQPNPLDFKGRGKWRKTAPSSQQAPLKVSSGAVVFRILCPGSKSGSVIGKGGSIITRIRKETSARIKLEDIVSGCEERVVVITGSEKNWLLQHEKEGNKDTGGIDGADDDKGNSEKDEEKGEENAEEKDDPSVSEVPKPEKGASSAQKALLFVFERIIADEPENDGGDEESLVSVRLLILASQVDCLRGKDGSVIKQMSSDSGAQIRILAKDKIPLCALAHDEVVQLPGEQVSPAQDGVLRVQHRIVMAVPDDAESTVLCRLLIFADQIGCLLGKGGAVIAEMRKLTGAHIRVLSKDQKPKNLPENDEVVQVTGGFIAVQEALLQITGRLKIHLFYDKVPAMGHAGHSAFVDQLQSFGPYMGREPSPTRMFPNLPPFQRDFGSCLQDERSTFAHPLHGSGFPPHGSERVPIPWAAHGTREGACAISEYGGIPQRRIGFAGRNQAAIITNTTLDVVVPRALVPAIYGEDGYCLRQICEISEAKVTITEPRPEAMETVIIISGTPEQTHAAQSLLQAFVLSETGSS